MFIDTHAHLDLCSKNSPIEQIVERAKEKDVNIIIDIGIDLDSCRRTLDNSFRYQNVYSALGIHPHEAGSVDAYVLKEIKGLAKNNKKVVAIGEIGLDYYRNLSSRETQQTAFRKQIEMAKELELPIIVHDRDAHSDCLRILKEETAEKVVFHCFSGDSNMLKDCIERGYFISIAGPVTFQNADKLKDIAAATPLERLMLETDCPFLTPHPFRGKPNEPSMIPLIAEKIAEIKKLELLEIAEITTNNAKLFFGV
ncbi:MAG: TatD family hydrolase [Actinobacteria bacterium]|nr:TatD family hydrolase [Actinomycetota bacterium]